MNEMKAYQCLKFLMGEDGQGFNRADSDFARSLHEQLLRKGGLSGSLSEKQLVSLVRLLSLYKGQLAGLVDKDEDWTFLDPVFSQVEGPQDKILGSREEQLLLLRRIELTTGLSFEQVSPKVSQEIDDWLSSNSQMNEAEVREIFDQASNTLVAMLDEPMDHFSYFMLNRLIHPEAIGIKTVEGALMGLFLSQFSEWNTRFGTAIITPTFIWDMSKRKLHSTRTVVYFGLKETSSSFLGISMSTKITIQVCFLDGSSMDIEVPCISDAFHLHRLLIVHTLGIMGWPVVGGECKTLQSIKRNFSRFQQDFSQVIRNGKNEIGLKDAFWYLFVGRVKLARDFKQDLPNLEKDQISDVNRHLMWKLMEMGFDLREVEPYIPLAARLDYAETTFCGRAMGNYAYWKLMEEGKLSRPDAKIKFQSYEYLMRLV